MIYGLYLSGQGAQAEATRLDVLANNLANASTDAFKRDLAIFQSHRTYDQQHMAPETPRRLRDVTGGVTVAEIATDFSDGPLRQTGGRLDVAVRGPGFFRVSDGRQTYLTRDGRFSIDQRGQLVSQATGYAVVGSGNGRIQIPPDRDIKIAADGRVFGVSSDGGSAQVGHIDLVRPESLGQLEKVGDSLYRSLGRVRPAGNGARLVQGHVEMSGTEPLAEMTDLIHTSRSFETNINMIRLQDESLAQLLQSVRPR